MGASRDQAATALKRGDRVRLRIASRWLDGIVIEDRGALGQEGRQIVRIEVSEAGTEDKLTFEVRAEDLEVAQAA